MLKWNLCCRDLRTAEGVVYVLHLWFGPVAFDIIQIDNQTADVDLVIRTGTTHTCTREHKT